mmetsp:Transcript_81539/g.174741  ORF Transcript_81539/g.174741 Transcript_81539/m.174741 type:complete len:254 (+) Transcript_81539:71-832(+)
MAGLPMSRRIPGCEQRRSWLLALSLGLACAVAFGRAGKTAPSTFTAGVAPLSLRPRALRGDVMRMGEAEAAAPAPSPAPAPSVALVKVTEESTMTAAGVLGGLVGLVFGGVWVGGALFVATSWLAKKEDDDLSKAVKGVAASGLEVLNFGAYINDKYSLTGGLGSAITGAIDSAKENPSTKEAASSASGVLDSVKDAVSSFDQDVGIKDTVGTILTSGTDLASQAVDKVTDLNDKYKVTDQIKEKIDAAIEQK